MYENQKPERDILLEHIDSLGIIEIHERSGVMEKIDLFKYLTRDEELAANGGYIDVNFTKKNKADGFQQYFVCIPCTCEQGSVVSLIAHVKGVNHIRKTRKMFRKETGMPPSSPTILPKAKKLKLDVPLPKSVVDRAPLSELLQKHEGGFAFGLKFIHEYLNPRRNSDPRWYTCTLKGCKSAWGTSNDMLRHLIGKRQTHNKNYLCHEVGVATALKMTSNELSRACKDVGYHLDREYGSIVRHVNDQAGYDQLRDRPSSWSEMPGKDDFRQDIKDSNKAIVDQLKMLERYPEQALGVHLSYHLKTVGFCLGVLRDRVTGSQGLEDTFRKTKDLHERVLMRLIDCFESGVSRLREDVEALENTEITKLLECSSAYKCLGGSPDKMENLHNELRKLKVRIKEAKRREADLQESLGWDDSKVHILKQEYSRLIEKYQEAKPMQTALYAMAAQVKRCVDGLLESHYVNAASPKQVKIPSLEEFERRSAHLVYAILKKDFVKYKNEGRKPETIVWKEKKREGIQIFVSRRMRSLASLIFL